MIYENIKELAKSYAEHHKRKKNVLKSTYKYNKNNK